MAQHLAPQRVPRPVPRPANLVPPVPAGLDVPEGFGRRGAVEGMYDGLDIQDETGDYGALGRGPRRRDPSEIVLHQTDSRSGDSTRETYAQRIRNGQHTGAHYLIDENGETSLTLKADLNNHGFTVYQGEGDAEEVLMSFESQDADLPTGSTFHDDRNGAAT